MLDLGEPEIQCTGVFISERRGQFWYRDTDTTGRRWTCEDGEEIRVTVPQTKEQLGPLAVGRVKGQFFFRATGGSLALTTPPPWTFSPQNCEKINLLF